MSTVPIQTHPLSRYPCCGYDKSTIFFPTGRLFFRERENFTGVHSSDWFLRRIWKLWGRTRAGTYWDSKQVCKHDHEWQRAVSTHLTQVCVLRGTDAKNPACACEQKRNKKKSPLYSYLTNDGHGKRGEKALFREACKSKHGVYRNS